MSRNRSNLSSQNKSIDCDDEVEEESATTNRRTKSGSLESRSPPENCDFVEFLDMQEDSQDLNLWQENAESSVQEKSPLHRVVKPNTTYKPHINPEAVENHRRIYRQLGIHVPESQPDHPLSCYSFIVKLFLATSLDSVDFLKWSADGCELEMDYQGLESHLTSGCSIFQCRNTLQFTGFLLAHEFERVLYREDTKSILLIYRHPNFSKDEPAKLQLLAEKSRDFEEEFDEKPEDPRFPPLNMPNAAHTDRMIHRGDLCSISYTCRSPLQVARCRFQTLLGYQADLAVLKERNSLDVFNKQKRGRSAINNTLIDTIPGKGSSTKYVKPHESVITIGIGQAPDYAGYYGRVELSKVNDFFSEYLPRYGSKITGYKDIVMDATNKSIGFQQNLPIGMDYSDDEDDALPPISLGLEMDFTPSTSAAAKVKTSSRKPVEDSDLEQAMQELCEGSHFNQDDDVPQSSSGIRPKPKPKPKAKAKPAKRLAKFLESSSSENEDSKEVEEKKHVKPKKIKMDAVEDDISYTVEIELDSEMPEIDERTVKKAKDQQYDEEDDDSEDDEDLDEEDDDDYIDKNVQYRNATEPPKRRRYDLRNSKRSPP
ncbi:uncharacterized protein LOC108090637 [Drosophila ficusphila]|uniref:uncharacterized protein LOC108090637 n=1 Tax=Drosophila ficusphila TaxID=30025 RepID=UPI0007E7119E|nr:uncharacterized protein LOC108090637 [Drosophila ficusphila]